MLGFGLLVRMASTLGSTLSRYCMWRGAQCYVWQNHVLVRWATLSRLAVLTFCRCGCVACLRLFALLLRFIPYHSQSNRKDNPCGKCVKFGPTNWTVRGSRDYSWTTPRLLPNGTRVLPELPFRKPGLLPPKFGTPLSENRISAEIVNFPGLGPVIGPADAIFGPAQS